MPDWLVENAWSAASLVTGFIAIFTAIVIALLQRRTKRITYQLVSRVRLVGTRGDIPELDVLFRGERVTDVQLVEFSVENTGNLAVAATDYERPIRISFGPEAAVLTADVLRVHPPALRLECQPDGNGITLQPVMLNGGDWVRIRTLVSQASKISAESRIVGVRDVHERRPGRAQAIQLLFGLGLFLVASGLVVIGTGLAYLGAFAALLAAAAVIYAPSADRYLPGRRRLEGSAPAPRMNEATAAPRTVLTALPAPTAVRPLPRPAKNPPPQLPWAPSRADLDLALEKATETAKAIGPDVILRLIWIDIFPAHEVNFTGTSELADRYFVLTVRENGDSAFYGVRRLSAESYVPDYAGDAPWRTAPGWDELVRLSWLRVPKPFTGDGSLRYRDAWRVRYDTKGELWESTCYELADGKPVEVKC